MLFDRQQLSQSIFRNGQGRDCQQFSFQIESKCSKCGSDSSASVVPIAAVCLSKGVCKALLLLYLLDIVLYRTWSRQQDSRLLCIGQTHDGKVPPAGQNASTVPAAAQHHVRLMLATLNSKLSVHYLGPPHSRCPKLLRYTPARPRTELEPAMGCEHVSLPRIEIWELTDVGVCAGDRKLAPRGHEHHEFLHRHHPALSDLCLAMWAEAVRPSIGAHLTTNPRVVLAEWMVAAATLDERVHLPPKRERA